MITDEQILELQQSIAGRVFPASGTAHTQLSELYEDGNTALGNYATDEDKQAARKRCSDYLNSRAK